MAVVATETLVNGHAIPTPPEAGRRPAISRKPLAKMRDAAPVSPGAELPRSASYTYLGEAAEPDYINPSLITSKGSFSDADLLGQEDEVLDITPPDSSGWNTPDELVLDTNVSAARAQDLIAELQKSTSAAVQRLSGGLEDDTSSVETRRRKHSASIESSSTASTVATTPATPRPRISVASNFSRKLNRRSWVSSGPSTPTSRSPSPPKKSAGKENGSDGASAPTPVVPSTATASGTVERKRTFRRKDSIKANKEQRPRRESSQSSDEQTVTRKPTLLRRKARPASGLFKSSPVDDDRPKTAKQSRPAVPPLPKSFSTDKLPTSRTLEQLSPDRAAPLPRLLTNERATNSSTLSLPRKKDELWSVFRALDGDFTKFSSKSVAFKANVVRSTLLPFLRVYANHPSNKTMRSEDLDRRANILNKWWTGLIEMLHGRNNQSISGTDRPAILDGISGIMERPEWRFGPSQFSPLGQRTKGPATPRNRSTTSLTSTTSDFLAESVQHNVRNIFIQNLSAQMAFVVDKMSLRNASASLVTFCGKACAFAFMFVPGMADVLVRLWDLQMDTIRRVLEENGIGKFDDLSAGAIISGFPPALHQLGFVSLMKYMRKLRTPPPLPLGTANIQWWGHWLERWTGRESDLFYVFVKHFHILAADFLPPNASRTDRMCAPGILLVHAQILTNLDATIHRDVSQAQQDSAVIGPTPTFDDVLADPDACATNLPVPPTNAVRLMAENRLIMLIRDFLSDRAAEYPFARRLFAESFNDLLQATARGTSMFDHAACYTLLDFMEEALVILSRFEQLKDSEGTLINPDFWKSVCKKMIRSQNTMTEIRLYSFLYTVWNSVVCDLGRKEDLCLGLLLDPEIFESRFNHWSPMVRAYFMRLLAWRVGRYDGDFSNSDVLILETLLDRLHTVWCHYLFLRDQADRQQSLPPPTFPCNPAPNRRLLIIRTDGQINPTGSLLTLDGIIPPKTPTNTAQPAWKRSPTMSHIIEVEEKSLPRPDSDTEAMRRGRGGIGGFFRNLVGSSKNRTKSQPSSRATTPAPTNSALASPALGRPGGLVRSATEDLQTPKTRAPDLDQPAPKPTPPSQHRNFSFKFSLEYHPNIKQLPPMRLYPPRLPMPAQQFLLTHSRKGNAPSALRPKEPNGASKGHARYCGRALAEWAVVLGECQSFFERRKSEGVPSNKFIETPTLAVEVFKRPG